MNIIKKNFEWALFLACLGLFILLQFATIQPAVQSRFFAFALGLFAHGPRFFPAVEGSPYPDYIALVMVLGDFIARLFGHVSVLSVSLPYCIAGALAILYTYRLGALENHLLGIYAALFCLLSWKFLSAASVLDLDLFVTLATIMCVFYGERASRNRKAPPYLHYCVILAISFLCRGPIGIVVPAMIMTWYYLFTQKQYRAACLLLLCSLILFSGSIGLMSFMAYQAGGKAFMLEVLGQEGMGRIVNEHAGRYYYFFTIGFLSYSLTALAALYSAFRTYPYWKTSAKTNAEYRFPRFCIAWTILLILLFTIPASKKARYIMPMVPAISLLAAYPWVKPELATIKMSLTRFLKLLPFLSLILGIVSLFTPSVGVVQSSVLSLVGLMGLLINYSFVIYPHKPERQDLFIMGNNVLQFLLIHLLVLSPWMAISPVRSSVVPWV